jgi:hypothetical protein
MMVRNGIKNQHFLFGYLLVTLGVELNNRIHLLWFPNVNISWVYKYYILFCILFFGVYYWKIFINKYKYIGLIITIVVLFFFAVFFQATNQIFNYELGVVIAVFYILLALLWFFYSLNHNLNQKITENPHFWISCALLLWACFFIYRIYPAQYLVEKDPSFHTVLKDVNYIVATIMYALMGIGLLKFNKQKV